MCVGQGDRAGYPRMSLKIVQSSGRVGHLKMLTQKLPVDSAEVRRLVYVATH